LLFRTLLAFLAFAFAASSIYIINDFFDINEDRAHPEKCTRPLASGAIGSRNALVLQVVLMLTSLVLSYWLSMDLFLVVCGYIGLNLLYSKWLKHIAILDVNIIAAGFVLRLLAGTAVTGIELSVWILLMTYLLALFLAIAKRRADVVHAQNGKEVRKHRRLQSGICRYRFGNPCIHCDCMLYFLLHQSREPKALQFKVVVFVYYLCHQWNFSLSQTRACRRRHRFAYADCPQRSVHPNHHHLLVGANELFIIRQPMRTLALFDFDGTLYKKDSLIEFTRFAKGMCRFTRRCCCFSRI
jgi:hypothetical protein